MIRRELAEAEGMERLSAEYLTLVLQPRRDALLARSGLSAGDLAAVRTSPARGPLLAAFREASARGLDIETAFARLVVGRSLTDAADVGAALHGRVERWAQAAGGRSRVNLIAGLIPRALGVTDPNMAQALTERDQAMEERAHSLADQATADGALWVQKLGPRPTSPDHMERRLREVSSVAADRDRWHIADANPLDERGNASTTEQTRQPQLAQAAVIRAKPSGARAEPDRSFPSRKSRSKCGEESTSD